MFKAVFKFIRPKILTTCYLIVFLGSVSVGDITLKTFLAIFVLIAWYIHAASSNDYADRKIDAINLQGANDRPLVTRSLSAKNLWIIHSSAGLLALVISVYWGFGAALLMVLVLILNYAYSFKPIRITDRGGVSQLMLPIAYVILPFSLGYLSTETTEPYPWLLVAGLYTGFAARLFLKDFRDVRGDKKFGKRTFLLRHGIKITCIASGVAGFISLMMLSVAISFSAGALSILVIGHIFALRLLMRLSKTKIIDQQMELIALLAKIANTSVVAILLYFITKHYLGLEPTVVFGLPLLTGLVFLVLIWRKYRHDIQAQLA